MHGHRRPSPIPAVALLVAAILVAGAASAQARDVAVRIEAREVVVPADRRIVVEQGEDVVIRWHSDENGELHLHGYDIRVLLRAGSEVFMRFHAKASGRFPVTSHGFGAPTGYGHADIVMLHIEVQPR